MKKRLSVKFIVGFIVLGSLMCAGSSIIGYRQYKNVIMSQYNDEAYKTAQLALSYVGEDKILQYVSEARAIKEAKADEKIIRKEMVSALPEYSAAADMIDVLRSKMGANDIFIFCVDEDELNSYTGDTATWKPLIYLFDSYSSGQSYSIGDTGSFNPKYINELEHIVFAGESVDSYFISNGNYGYNTSALLPVVKDGKTIAIVAVEIPMLTLEGRLKNYLISAVLVTIILICCVIAVGTVYYYRTLIMPIKRVSRAAGDFVKNHNTVTEELRKISTKDEIEELAQNVLKMERDINEYIDDLTKVTAEKERIGAELNVATKIQADMLPSIFPPFPERNEMDVYATMNPAKEVGGDFYDFFLIDENHIALVMADVSGKGVPAALFMVIAKTLIKNRALLGESPAQVMENVNNQLCEGNDAGMFVTAWLGIIDLTDGSAMASNAGHEHPVIRRAGGEYEFVKTKHSPALAVMDGLVYEEHSFKLNPGDSLYVYTDGVPEAGNSQQEFFGFDRLLKVLNANPQAAPKQITTNVKKAIDEFVGDADQFDDITMLAFKYLGKD